MPTTETKEITNSDDVIDVRDVIARVEHLEEQPTLDDDGACYSCGLHQKSDDEDHDSDCEVLELQRLTALLDELGGNSPQTTTGWWILRHAYSKWFQDGRSVEAKELQGAG